MRSLFGLLILLLSFSINAQEKRIEVYSQFTVWSDYKPQAFFIDERIPFRYNGTSLAFRSMNEGKFRQISVKPIFYSSELDQNSYDIYGGDLVYDYGRSIQNIKGKFDLLLGYSTWLGFLQEEINSIDFSGFPSSKTNVGLSTTLLTGIEYRLTDHISIECTAGFFSLALFWNRQYIDDPSLMERQKEQTGFDFDLFGQRNLRLGVGYTFGTNE